MKNYQNFIQSVYQIAQQAARNKIAHLNTEDESFQDNSIIINHKKTVNFGSCSYLGLEFDERLKEGAKNAVDNYGTQFSCSRAYVSLGLYKEFEDLCSQIFKGGFPLITPTTTLGHLATIPIVVGDQDLVILDHQVHSSVQSAVQMLKVRGIAVEMIRHNNMDMLEEKIQANRNNYRKIWYMADGIYSMYGDSAPIAHIHKLLDKYTQLHLYIDDAHGMSCFGEHGAGYVLAQAPMHPKQIVAVSLAKAFATGGAVILFPNQEQCTLVRSCGGPMITSGPLQPANLGAAIEAAKIHLSDEIEGLQEDLAENIKFTQLMLKKYKLPIVHESDSPVFFIGVSLPKIGNAVIKKMVENGYYLNLGVFPAVPLKNTGIRFTITRLHTFKQIEDMIACMAHHFFRTLQEEGIGLDKIYHAFKMTSPEEKAASEKVETLMAKSNISIETYTSIKDIKRNVWDQLFLNRGTFDWDGLNFLERSFAQNKNPFNKWEFDYFIVKDEFDKPILATFFTTAIGKDDMLDSAAVSEKVEEMRAIEGPNYLTSKTVMMGSLLTEGEHLFIDENHEYWKAAMECMFDFSAALQEKYQANAILYREFKKQNLALDDFFMENGFVKSALPNSHSLDVNAFANMDEWLQNLSAKSRRHVRKNILRKEEMYEVSEAQSATDEDINHWYDLYSQVKQNSLALNTNALPFHMFKKLAKSPNWEILELRIKAHITQKPVAVIFNYKSGSTYSAMFIGVDYKVQESHMPYRQALYQTIKRAKALNTTRLELGFTADFEKTRLGAKSVTNYGYMQMKDHYNASVIQNISASSKPKKQFIV